VRPLISLTHPAPNQVPRLVRAAHPPLVPQSRYCLGQSTAAPVCRSLARVPGWSKSAESQQPTVTGCHQSTRCGDPRARDRTRLYCLSRPTRVRDEEAVGSNPATPTLFQQVRGQVHYGQTGLW